MNQKLLALKKILQLTFNQKSIKINKDGSIQIIYRFKPKEFLVNKSTKELEINIIKKLEAITCIKYRITKMQKEPSFCYNTYVRVINVSSATSKDKIKHFLRYFEKQENEKFEKTSYQQIILNIMPIKKEEFQDFLNS